MNICRTLGMSSGAHEFDIDVIDAELSLKEALEMNLAVETFTRKKAIPQGLKLTKLEREYFTGELRGEFKRGKQRATWINCKRVELNALSADPWRFIEWLEAALGKHGVAKKWCRRPMLSRPKLATMRRHVRSQLTQEVNRQLNVDRIIDSAFEQISTQFKVNDVPKHVREWAKQLRSESWREAVDVFAMEKADSLHDDIDDIVEKQIEAARIE